MAPRVTEIPATLTLNSVSKVSFKKRKTAGYARVSTMQEEQAGSYETQLKYYKNYIQSREDWVFVGMYVFHFVCSAMMSRILSVFAQNDVESARSEKT